MSLSARLFGAKSTALALVFGAMSPALFAQDKLGREINFVRALAKDLRFIELAKAEADRLASAFRGAGDQDKIAQLSVEVAYYGARSRNKKRASHAQTAIARPRLVTTHRRLAQASVQAGHSSPESRRPSGR